MLALEVRVDDKIAAKLEALRSQSSSLDRLISQAVRKYAFLVVEGAKALVPISTGHLRRSIQAEFYDGGHAAIIGSYLPYAVRQEYDVTLDHSVRPARRRQKNTRAGRRGSIIKGTVQSNPAATWGFMRKSLAKIEADFLAEMRAIAQGFGEAWSE